MTIVSFFLLLKLAATCCHVMAVCQEPHLAELARKKVEERKLQVREGQEHAAAPRVCL